MRFGIYAETQCPPEKPHYDLTWEIVRQMIHADEVGFDSYSVIKHHFFPQFGISANPLAMFVAAAQHTQRIRFRTLCHTLPLHIPCSSRARLRRPTFSPMAASNVGWDEDTPGFSPVQHVVCGEPSAL
jgi:Luciferase-like monooxygenase